MGPPPLLKLLQILRELLYNALLTTENAGSLRQAQGRLFDCS